MHQKSTVKSMLLISSSCVLLVVWMILTFNARAEFQNIARTEPLAMINALFPHFWIILLTFASLCIAAIHLESDTRWLHMILLGELSLMLYFTPFILSGFSWNPDSLWHGGVARYMPEILSGSSPALSHYARSYPLSFITTYCAEQVLGLKVFEYTLYVYPLTCIIAISMLAYIFASRFLTPKMAFVSLLFALPALHFIEPHTSPFSEGTVLVLVSLVLLTIDGRIAKLALFFTVFSLILTHPISPISLSVFLLAVGCTYAYTKVSSENLRVHISSLLANFVSHSIVLFLGIFWLAWTMFWTVPLYPAVEYAILNTVTLRFLSRLEYVTEWTAGGQSFIYSEISGLTLAVYATLLFAVLALLFWDAGLSKSRWRKRTKLRKDGTRNQVEYKRIFLAFASLGYALLAYMLFLATRARFLLGRGLFFFILMACMSISAYLTEQNQRGKKFKEFATAILILFLFFSFPFLSYSKEAYNTFTPSADHGLTFVASHIDLSNKSISMGYDQQLAAYINLSKGFLKSEYPPRLLNGTSPDYVVLRVNSFFFQAMRYELSFERNQYVELQDSLKESLRHNKIYSSPTFEAYYSSGD